MKIVNCVSILLLVTIFCFYFGFINFKIGIPIYIVIFISSYFFPLNFFFNYNILLKNRSAGILYFLTSIIILITYIWQELNKDYYILYLIVLIFIINTYLIYKNLKKNSKTELVIAILNSLFMIFYFRNALAIGAFV